MIKQKRSWFVGAAFLLATLMFVGWICIRQAGEASQYRTKDVISKLGGQAYFSYQLRYDDDYERRYDGNYDPLSHPFFDEIVIIDLSEGAISDSDLGLLRTCPSLEELDLSGTRITGEGLRHLQGHEQLDVLSMANSSVDERNLKYIPDSVRFLDLTGTELTDEGIEHLSHLTKAIGINADGSQLTSDGVRKLLKSLPHTRVRWNGEWHSIEDTNLRAVD